MRVRGLGVSIALRIRHEERLPRYTSYPTALQFSSTIMAPTYEQWLAMLPNSTRTSLYFHVPFCRSMCSYCGCYTTITQKDDPIDGYIDLLRREMELVISKTSKPLALHHIHFGGATPTIVSPEVLLSLMESLRGMFDIAAATEVAAEIDPRMLTPEMMEALGESGFTRASLGVQGFDPRVQRAINRVQSVACLLAR